jgi:hypothetical protein
MQPKPVLVVAAAYMALLGLGFMFFPRQIGIDAVPAEASPALIAYLRIFGGPCLGIAVLNWMVRNAASSPLLDAVLLGNIVGFGCVSAMDIWGVSSGDARPAATGFLPFHLLMTAAFVFAGWSSLRARRFP